MIQVVGISLIMNISISLVLSKIEWFCLQLVASSIYASSELSEQANNEEHFCNSTIFYLSCVKLCQFLVPIQICPPEHTGLVVSSDKFTNRSSLVPFKSYRVICSEASLFILINYIGLVIIIM